MYVNIYIEKHEASASSTSQVLLKIPKFVDTLTVPQGKFPIAFYKMFERNYTPTYNTVIYKSMKYQFRN